MNEKLFSLPVADQITPYISLRLMGELPVVVIAHPKVRAAVTLQGAQLVAAQPDSGCDDIWLTSMTAEEREKDVNRE